MRHPVQVKVLAGTVCALLLLLVAVARSILQDLDSLYKDSAAQFLTPSPAPLLQNSSSSRTVLPSAAAKRQKQLDDSLGSPREHPDRLLPAAVPAPVILRQKPALPLHESTAKTPLLISPEALRRVSADSSRSSRVELHVRLQRMVCKPPWKRHGQTCATDGAVYGNDEQGCDDVVARDSTTNIRQASDF